MAYQSAPYRREDEPALRAMVTVGHFEPALWADDRDGDKLGSTQVRLRHWTGARHGHRFLGHAVCDMILRNYELAPPALPIKRIYLVPASWTLHLVSSSTRMNAPGWVNRPTDCDPGWRNSGGSEFTALLDTPPSNVAL